MYIEPNVKMLKKTFLGSTMFLIIVFLLFFIVMWGKEAAIEEPKVIGLSGELIKEDGVFWVDKQVIFSEKNLDGLVGETVAVVGTLDDEGLLMIDQLLTSPKEEPKKIPESETYRATAKSNLAFSVNVPNSWQVRDKSTDANGWLVLTKGKKKIELNRFPDAEDIGVQFEPVPVSEKPILINGFPYLEQRAIAQTTKRMMDYITPSEECLKDDACPRFMASSNESDPETTVVIQNVMSDLVFLPEPQGWKILRHSLKNSDWNMYLYYPPEFELVPSEKGYVLMSPAENIDIHIADEIPGHHITGVGEKETEIIKLPTRDEKLYHTESPKDGKPFDAMLLRNPDDTQHILITGLGHGFNAAIRTIVFEEKQ